jgi:hypothetical protein
MVIDAPTQVPNHTLSSGARGLEKWRSHLEEGILETGAFAPIEKGKASAFIDHELFTNWLRIHLFQMEKLISEVFILYLEKTQNLAPPE